MQFQFNSDNRVSADFAPKVEALVQSRLERISDRLTRVEVHVGDVNGSKEGADDKRCQIEIRPKGMSPISASDQAATIEGAVASAADKVLTAFERQIGRQTTRKGH